MKITSKEKQTIFKKFGKDAKDTGSVFSQIALFTSRITGLSEHLSRNKKDYATQRSLQLIVGKRRKLLDYIKPDHVHVLIDGQIVRSGGKDLALELEDKGYSWLAS